MARILYGAAHAQWKAQPPAAVDADGELAGEAPWDGPRGRVILKVQVIKLTGLPEADAFFGRSAYASVALLDADPLSDEACDGRVLGEAGNGRYSQVTRELPRVPESLPLAIPESFAIAEHLPTCVGYA